MRNRLPGGLRGRLLVAFVLTSAVTLAVVSGILLGPLREQLRQQSTDNLEGAVLSARLPIEGAWDDDFELTSGKRLLNHEEGQDHDTKSAARRGKHHLTVVCAEL